MKICIISSIFSPYARGGAEVVVENTARAFAKAGHDVFVITCAPFEGWRSFAGRWSTCDVKCQMSNVKCSLHVFRFTPFNLFTIFNISKYPLLLRLFWHILDMFNLHTYLVVRRILREENPDLIITRSLKGLGYTVPLAIKNAKCKMQNLRWFHGLHDLGALHPRGFMEWKKERAIHNPKPPVWLYRVLCRKLFGSPDAVIAPSRFVLDEYARAGFFVKSKKAVVRNPVISSPPPEVPLPGVGEQHWERLQRVPPSGMSERGPLQLRTLRQAAAPRFLYLGQLEPYKGLRVLLDAWQGFVAKHPNEKLVIAGRGSMEDEIKKAKQELRGVEYRGFIAHDKIVSVLEGARFLIMPSLAYETFGLVIAESFSAGVPVIASRIGAIPELVQHGIDGFLFQPGDSQALVQTMEIALSSSWGQLSQNAKKSAEEFTLEKYGEELLALHNSLTKK